MKITDNNYDWGEWNDHYWLATDNDHHVALVSCMDPYVLPSNFRLDWRWLAGIDERLAEYYSGNTCSRIDFPELSDLLQRKGFFVIDSCRLGKKSELEYLDPLSNPIDLEDLPKSFKTIASFFTLPGFSFANHPTISSADWKKKVESVPDVELLPMCRSVELIPISCSTGGFSICPKTPYAGTRCQEYCFLEFRFLPDSNLISESFLPTPHVISWSQYNSCFKKFVDSLFSISSSGKLEFIFRDDCQNNDPFIQMETEPPLAIRYYRLECLTAELLLKESPPNGLAGGSGNLYAFSLFTSHSVKKHFVKAVREICCTMGIEVTLIENGTQFRNRGTSYVWKTLKSMFSPV